MKNEESHTLLPVFFKEALFPIAEEFSSIAEEFSSMAEQFSSMADGAKSYCLSSN